MECDCGAAGASTTRRESAYQMITVRDALATVLREAVPLPPVSVKSTDSLGLVLAEAVQAQDPLPPFRASIMDGYAVVAEDGVGEFPVVERIAAGSVPVQRIRSGQVAYITTGSPVPEGANAVVKIEDTDGVFDDQDPSQEKGVRIHKAVCEGANIRPIGSDIAAGQELITSGEVITPAEVGLLATAGISSVNAYRQPIVGVLSTGSELKDAFNEAAQGQIRDSNRPMLLALLSSQHVTTVDLGICRDAKDDLESVVYEALTRVDVLITTGGVSMGDHDLIKPLLERIGSVQFGRLHMKPGKPTTFATINTPEGPRRLVFALPGNPVSTFATFHLLVVPALKRMRGLPLEKCIHTRVTTTLTHTIRLDPERPEFHRATIVWDSKQNKFWATSTGRQISSRLLSCRNANALLCLPTGSEAREGSTVEAIMLDSTFFNGMIPALVPTHVSPPSATQVENPTAPVSTRVFRAAILTVSDRVSRGEAKDLSGPAMQDMLRRLQSIRIDVVASAVVPDESDHIARVVTDWADKDIADLVLTSGGTGFAPRDVTPEAIKTVLHKEVPGFVIAMMNTGLSITAKASLSRPVAGIRHRTLIITLPGKPKAVIENFSAIADVLPHALHLVRDEPHEHHRAKYTYVEA